MIFTRSIGKYPVSLLFLLLLASCAKQEYKPQSTYYLSSEGGTFTNNYGVDVVLPEGALLESQAINVDGNWGSNDEPSTIYLDSASGYGFTSYRVGFACFNCTSLQKPGTMQLTTLTDTEFTFGKAMPYSVDIGENVKDTSNWDPIGAFTVVPAYFDTYKYTFEFTELKKIYFIGWIAE